MGRVLKDGELTEKRIKITELAQLSGVSKSTIHHYLNMGLLDPPRKLGLSHAIYDSGHLSKLQRIRELRENQKLSLLKIKEVLARDNGSASPSVQKNEAESLISALEEERSENRARKSEMKRIEIMDAAIGLFSKNGYEKTTIEAIAESLHMAKGTVYLYFESKEDLFMECIKRLTIVAVPEEAWDGISAEKDALKRLRKRGHAFHRAFPSYKGILTMTKASLGGDNRKLAEKAKDTLTLMTHPITKDLRRGMADGLFRDMEEELVAHLILAMGEGLGCRLMMDSRYTIEQGVDTMFDVLARGILKRESSEPPQPEPEPCSGSITDLKGMTTEVANLRFETSAFLQAKMGEADVRIDPNKVREITVNRKNNVFRVEITGKDGKAQTAEVDPGLVLNGDVPLGEFVIGLKHIERIVFLGKR